MSKEKNLLELALKSLKLDIQIYQSPNMTEPVHNPNSFVVHSAEFSLSGSKYTANLAIPKEILTSLTKELPEYYDMELDLKTILDHCREVIFVSDANGKAMRVSSSWKKLWEAEGKGFFDKGVLQVEKEGVISPSATRLVLEKKEQVQIVQQTDTGRTLMVTGIPIKNEAGDIQRIISMSEDITEISSLKQELKSEKVKNEKLNALLYDHEVSSLVFNSAAMDNVLHTVLKIANVDSTVLITGESGVGKEVIAHYIHKWSDRADKPFIKVNCGSIPENLLESELFGYTKGSFTGALKEGKQGLFEAANEGTIFLDEIGEMPFSLQVKLLRVLQEQEVTRIGDTSPTKINVRVIAATNRSLPEEIKKKSFREDLYYRLNVVPIHIPPLRERREDLLPLILHFTDEFNRKFSKRKVFSQEAIKQFYSYSWPGNIRELRNIIERLIVIADADYLEPVHLLSFLRDETRDLAKMQAVRSVEVSRDLQPSSMRNDHPFPILSQLARHYRQVGITHGEWGLICAIFTYKAEDCTFHVTEEELATHLDCGTRQIRKWLYSLRKKEMLIIERSWKKTGFNFKPLLVKAERAVRV
ncbi:sigma-54 interaction domain-containing protein [Neobacillus mesonae]|uniref:sigma-54 interaction domain-containing protein n=1 Tax=Neobacillus mesonae TaxID=1193713 RepID=UPI002E1ED9A7|nr:sigma 54-interacting transcriptional regulator [Neobacillus mesonae]MED4205402.1 sigma 54-interacting transcriptional regulator [Neobacillus mesonae]